MPPKPTTWPVEITTRVAVLVAAMVDPHVAGFPPGTASAMGEGWDEQLIGSKGLFRGSMPSWHSALLPHPNTLASVVRATECVAPAARAMAVTPGTVTGVGLSVVFPSPS